MPGKHSQSGSPLFWGQGFPETTAFLTKNRELSRPDKTSSPRPTLSAENLKLFRGPSRASHLARSLYYQSA